MTNQSAFSPPRMIGLTLVTLVVTGFVVYLVTQVPIAAKHPPDPALQSHQITAVVFYVLMALVVVLMVMLIRRSLRKREAEDAAAEAMAATPAPSALRLTFEHVSPSMVLITAAVSAALLVGTTLINMPIWAIAIFTLLPWVPIYFSIARWQFRQFGMYALFGMIVLLQIGHLGEHISQNIELIMSHGNVKTSLGIFGFLNQEAVHFIWNVLILGGTGFLLMRFGRNNPWLWITFYIGAFHGVEHFYLYWLYLTDYHNFVLAASPGIWAKGGLISTPLARPYLHLVYNYIEITPFLIAFWDCGKRLRIPTTAPSRGPAPVTEAGR
ncbi:MAG TPA: hypothetical protein VOB72_02630 [Candidatus Dormibacteraeota bacterium]|nr:hypothetical protein [Candidatus Dormibacteraeota bacterium]